MIYSLFCLKTCWSEIPDYLYLLQNTKKKTNTLALHVPYLLAFLFSLQGTKKSKQALKTKDYPANYISSETTDCHVRTKKGTHSTTKQAITITISSTVSLMRKVIVVTITMTNKAWSNRRLDPAATGTVLTRCHAKRQTQSR